MTNTLLKGIEFKVSVNVDEIQRSTQKIREQVKKMDKSVGKSGKSIGLMKESINKAGDAFTGMRLKMMAFLKAGAALWAINKAIQTIIASFQAANRFESAFAGVLKTVDGLDDGFGNLTKEGREMKKEMRDLAKEIPVAVDELARIGELGGQLGVPRKHLIEFTATMAQMAITTNMSAEMSATSFARLANVMETPISQMSNLGSAVVDLGNNSATTESEIMDFTLRIMNAGKLVNMTEAELLSMGAAFSSVGIQAEAGGTSVQTGIQEINKAVVKGGRKLEIFAQFTNKTAEEFKAQWKSDPAEVFTQFIERLGDSGEQGSIVLEELLGKGSRLERAFLSMASAGDLMRNSIELGTKAFEENNALNEEAQKRFNTTESQIQLVKNQWIDWSIAVGDFLKGPAVGFIYWMTQLTKAFMGVAKTMGIYSGLILLNINGIYDSVFALAKNTLTVVKNLGKNMIKAMKLDFDFTSLTEGTIKVGYSEETNQSIAKLKNDSVEAQEEIQESFFTSADIQKTTEEMKRKETEKTQAEMQKFLDQLQSEEEDAAKKRQDAAEKEKKLREKAIEDYQDKINETITELEKLEEAHTKLRENAKKELEELGYTLQNLQNDYDSTISKLENSFASKVSSEVVELKAELEGLQAELATARANGDDTTDIRAKIASTESDIAAGSSLVSEDDLAEAERVAGLSRFEKMKEDLEAEKALRQEEFEASKAILEEKAAVYQAFLDGNLASLTDIHNRENQLLAEKFAAEEASFDERSAALIGFLEESVQKQSSSLSQMERENARVTQSIIAHWNAVRAAKDAATGRANGGIVQKFASGGMVRGPGGPRDDKVPAMLSNGEFVINAQSTALMRPFLESLNRIKSANQLPRFADGGMAGVTNNNSSTKNITINAAEMGGDLELIADRLAWDNRF